MCAGLRIETSEFKPWIKLCVVFLGRMLSPSNDSSTFEYIFLFVNICKRQ